MPERHREVEDPGFLNPQTKHAGSKCPNLVGPWDTKKLNVYIVYTGLMKIWVLDMPLFLL